MPDNRSNAPATKIRITAVGRVRYGYDQPAHEFGISIFAVWHNVPRARPRTRHAGAQVRAQGLRRGYAHHDPLLSSRKTAIVSFSHSWVVLGVIVHLPFCAHG
jgi:hypothetical protein